MSGREAQGSLLFHGQRKPTQSSGRLGVLFSGSAPTAFCRDDSCGPRTDRNAKDLTTKLNGYLDFPHVGQAFVIERHRTNKKSGESSLEVSYGLTSRPPKQAGPQRILRVNRGHWAIESCHYMIDWNDDDDRPENFTRLRRFAIGVLKSKGRGGVAQKMRRLTRNVRLVFDYLRMSENSCACHVK